MPLYALFTSGKVGVEMKEKIGMGIMLLLYTVFGMIVMTSPLWANL